MVKKNVFALFRMMWRGAKGLLEIDGSCQWLKMWSKGGERGGGGGGGGNEEKGEKLLLS